MASGARCQTGVVDMAMPPPLQLDGAPRRLVGDVTVVKVQTPEGEEVTYELGVLEELQTVFNPEMAYASYIPFYCLIGEDHRRSVTVRSHRERRGDATPYKVNVETRVRRLLGHVTRREGPGTGVHEDLAARRDATRCSCLNI